MRLKNVVIICGIMLLLCGCGKEQEKNMEGSTEQVKQNEQLEEEASDAEQWKKGYDLPVDEKERQEAEEACN